jgi:Ca2+-binding EF-hand superfamily protein
MRRAPGPILALFGPLLAVIQALAADKAPAPIATTASADVQDMLFLGPMRPLILRLRVTIDGVPFRDAWQERFSELFALADRARGGRVTIADAESIARDMNGGLRDNRQLDFKSIAEGDATERSALAAFIEKTYPPFAVRRRASIARDSALALFPLLDTDQNHQLSAAELGAAEAQLKQRDFNDDRVITRGELILDPNAIAAAADPSTAERNLDPDDSQLMAIDATTTPAQITERLLKHYDRNRDGRLTTAPPEIEIALPPVLLVTMDANGDGGLDREELARFADRRPDLELSFAMGRSPAAASRRRQRPTTSDGFRVRETLRGGYKLELGDSEIDFKRENRDPRQADLVELRTYDRDANGYIDMNEAAANNISKAAFASMDSDGDGKVFKGEFTSFMTRQNAAAAVRLQLEVTDEGQNLFEVLDVDGDGVLSPREMREARKILAAADKNGDGALNGDELPQKFTFELVRGADELTETALRRGATVSTAKAGTSGPLWYRKMDRNNDGDISLHEFVGPLETFRRLDANHDGFIDREEAEAAGK